MDMLLDGLKYFCYFFTGSIIGGFTLAFAIAAWIDRQNRKHRKDCILSRYEFDHE